MQKEEVTERNIIESKYVRAEQRKGYWKQYTEENSNIDKEIKNKCRDIKDDKENDDELKERRRFVMEMKTNTKANVSIGLVNFFEISKC